MNSISGIYIILNSRDGKIYLGQAQNIKRRWQDHRRLLNAGKHSNRHLQNAWNKYDAKVFQFKILESCAVDQLDNREQYYLDIYMPKGICYNLSPSSKNVRGIVRSEETRQKLREAHTRRLPPSEETKRKISEGLKGHKNTLGKKQSLEAKIKIGKASKGHTLSEESRAKIGLASKGRKHSPESENRRIEQISQWWIIISPEGVETKIKNLSQFCRENGLIQQLMHNVAHGKQRQHKGWRCYKL